LRSIILRWIALFVVERNAWLTRFGELDVTNMGIMFGHEDMVAELGVFCCATKTILKNDVTLFALVHCLILFDPREANLVDRQLINTFRDRYVILLKHYLESEYSFTYTERYLRAIMDKVAEMRNIAEKSLCVFSDFLDFIPPLTKQVLNI
jgi:nuclear receptor subfamily 1 group I